MIRLFVALPVPDPIRDDLMAMCHGFPHINWVDWDNFHLTLRFIGNVDHGIADDVHEALSRIETHAMEIIPESLGFFGNKRSANAIIFRMRKTDALINLQKKIEFAMQQCGLQPESRKFCPHITLARMRDMPSANVERFVASRAASTLPSFSANRMVLYSSMQTSQGPFYREEADYPFIDYAQMVASMGEDFWTEDANLSDEFA